jgi:hypothetical protein
VTLGLVIPDGCAAADRESSAKVSGQPGRLDSRLRGNDMEVDAISVSSVG